MSKSSEMGKRYYCDYCDKSFADNPQNRKMHMQGIVHDRLRKLHYAQFKEPEDILAEEVSKPSCKNFQKSGFCSFEGKCRFSHMTPEWHRELTEKIEAKRRVQEAAREQVAREPEPTVEGWLAKRAKRRKTDSGGDAVHPEGGQASGGIAPAAYLNFRLPEGLRHIPDLPPSLLPPTGDCPQEDAEWGL